MKKVIAGCNHPRLDPDLVGLVVSALVRADAIVFWRVKHHATT